MTQLNQDFSKMSRYRARMRARGLRPVQLWVPDTRRQGFAEECRRQALAVARHGGEIAMAGYLSETAATIEGWE